MNIRNQGFERGNTSFWSVSGFGTFAIEAGETHRGGYACAVTTHATFDTASVQHDDLIEVAYGGVVEFGIWVKGTAGDMFYIKVLPHDSDLNTLSQVTIKTATMTGGWQYIRSQYVVGSDERYLKAYLDFVSVLGSAVYYIDDLAIETTSIDDYIMRVLEIADLENKTASGDTTVDMHRMYGFRDYYAEIDVTSMTGTTPTCDVSICELDQYGNERVIGTFTQFNAVTDQRVGIASPIGVGMYVKYVMGGTVTDCDFKVSVVGVR